MILVVEALDYGRGQVRYRIEDQSGNAINRGVQTFHATLTRRHRECERLLGSKDAHLEVACAQWPAPWPSKARGVKAAQIGAQAIVAP
jgi:hypothetical protein